MIRKSNAKIIGLLILLIALIIAATMMIQLKNKPDQKKYSIPAGTTIDGTILNKPRHLSNFELLDTEGKPFTEANLKGHWTLMFFGFTHCGYICPTTMAVLKKTVAALQKKVPTQFLPQVVMVSLDPARDSTKRLREYVKSFNTHFIGVRGDINQTKNLARQMSVVFSTIKMEHGNYAINHSAEIMLVDPNGNLRVFFDYPHQAQQMVKDYEKIIYTLQS